MKARFLLSLCTLALLTSFSPESRGQLKIVTVPGLWNGASSVAPAAIDAGDYVYISAQGPQERDGGASSTFTGQVRTSLDHINAIVKAAGLTIDHVVYVQVYLDDMSHYPDLDIAFNGYFPKTPPARSVLGVAKIPEFQVQINAIAVRDLTGKQAVLPPNFKPSKAYSPGMLTHDRLFISTMLGADPASGKIPDDPAAQVDRALDNMKSVLEAAKLTLAHMVFVNPYLTDAIPTRVMNQQYAQRFEFGNTPGRATIQVSSLPDGNHIAYTGVAVRDLSQRHAIRPKNMPPSPTASPCVFAGDTLFCSAKSGFIPGPNGGVFADSTANQARQTMRNQLDNLEEADMKFSQVVSTTVYLDNLADSGEFHKVYEKYFGGTLPAETLLQQIPSASRKSDDDGRYPDLEQMSLIAVRTHPNH